MLARCVLKYCLNKEWKPLCDILLRQKNTKLDSPRKYAKRVVIDVRNVPALA